MMNYKFLKLSLAFLAIFSMISCEEETLFDEVRATTTSGAILRTLGSVPNSYNLTDLTSEFSISLEEQDASGGNNVEAVNLYISLIDNTEDNGETNTGEVLAASFTEDTWGTTVNGNPQIDFAITLGDALTALGIAPEDIDGGDEFVFRFEVALKDGRTFSSNDVSGTVAGSSFFRTPYAYRVLVVCVLPEVPSGTWRIDMQDAFGDGWQPTTADGGGPGVSVVLSNGTTIELGLCTPYEDPGYDCVEGDSSGSQDFDIPPGVETGQFIFNGDFWGEMSFQIYAPSGNLVGDFPIGTPAGELSLNLCREGGD